MEERMQKPKPNRPARPPPLPPTVFTMAAQEENRIEAIKWPAPPDNINYSFNSSGTVKPRPSPPRPPPPRFMKLLMSENLNEELAIQVPDRMSNPPIITLAKNVHASMQALANRHGFPSEMLPDAKELIDEANDANALRLALFLNKIETETRKYKKKYSK